MTPSDPRPGGVLDVLQPRRAAVADAFRRAARIAARITFTQAIEIALSLAVLSAAGAAVIMVAEAVTS